MESTSATEQLLRHGSNTHRFSSDVSLYVGTTPVYSLAPAPSTRFTKETSLRISSQALIETGKTYSSQQERFAANNHPSSRRNRNPHLGICPTAARMSTFFLRCSSPCLNNSGLLPRTSTSFTRFSKKNEPATHFTGSHGIRLDLLHSPRTFLHDVRNHPASGRNRICILSNCPSLPRMTAVFPQMYLSTLEQLQSTPLNPRTLHSLQQRNKPINRSTGSHEIRR